MSSDPTTIAAVVAEPASTGGKKKAKRAGPPRRDPNKPIVRKPQAFTLNQGRVAKFVRKHSPLKRMSVAAGAYVAGLLEVLTMELLLHAGKGIEPAKESGVVSIAAKDIRTAGLAQPHLAVFFRNAAVMGGGVDATYHRHRYRQNQSREEEPEQPEQAEQNGN